MVLFGQVARNQVHGRPKMRWVDNFQALQVELAELDDETNIAASFRKPVIETY